MNSIELKRTLTGVVELKKERLEQAKEFYIIFKKSYINSKYIPEVDDMAIAIEEELKNYTGQKVK